LFRAALLPDDGLFADARSIATLLDATLPEDAWPDGCLLDDGWPRDSATVALPPFPMPPTDSASSNSSLRAEFGFGPRGDCPESADRGLPVVASGCIEPISLDSGGRGSDCVPTSSVCSTGKSAFGKSAIGEMPTGTSALGGVDGNASLGAFANGSGANCEEGR